MDVVCIVNVVLIEVLGVIFNIVLYMFVKYVVVGFICFFVVDLGKEGIIVNCICFGVVCIGIIKNIFEESKIKFVWCCVFFVWYVDLEEVV